MPTCLFAAPPTPHSHLPTHPGAGSGNSLAFQDLSGQDLRKNKYTKADLRGVNMRWVGGGWVG